jgi:amino acid transporter
MGSVRHRIPGLLPSTAGVLALVHLAAHGMSSAAAQPQDPSRQVIACIDKYLGPINPPGEIAKITAYGKACAELIRQQNSADFGVASNAVLVNQRFNTNVLLWMVVGITLSGVLLAALQLLGSYRLAQAGHGQFADGSEANLETGKVAVKSSVVGVIILAMSLAFFVIFVKYVYPITDSKGNPIGAPPSGMVGGKIIEEPDADGAPAKPSPP